MGEWRYLDELDVTDLQALMLKNRGDELPLFVSYSTFANIVRVRYVSKWRAPMQKLLEDYERLVQGTTKRAIASVHANPPLQRHVQSIVDTLLKEVVILTQHVLDENLALETRPFTLNHYLYDVFMKLRTEPLLQSLDTLSGNNDNANVSMGAVKALLKSHCGIGKASNEEQQAKELHIAISAYMQVAKKRFTDAVPMLLEMRLLQPLVASLQIRLVGDDATDELLERVLFDSVIDVEAREALNAQRQSLIQSKAEIAALTGS
ncbi:dynamin [Achlya hypogyna]|uniref:Dynamin n=1 Tax=Achlya hypogyna TaxID=1202772 RepID=A0A1V9YXW2_ACHHY|nr:dynamin [Achlya hypogyna]